MIDPTAYEFASGLSIVEKMVEVEVDFGDTSETIRIEAKFDPSRGSYSTAAYRLEHFTIQPTYPIVGGRFERTPEEVQLWVDYELPWTDRESADAAIEQALGFLSDAVR